MLQQFGLIGLEMVLLTVFAVEFVAVLALEGLIWELKTYHTFNFLHHFALELILNLVLLDIQLWDWLRSHNSFNGSVRNEHIS